MPVFENVPKIKLSSGYDIPQLGLGSWLSEPGQVGQAFRHALDIGYRHFDCAYLYLNQEEIGEVFHEYISTGRVSVY